MSETKTPVIETVVRAKGWHLVYQGDDGGYFCIPSSFIGRVGDRWLFLEVSEMGTLGLPSSNFVGVKRSSDRMDAWCEAVGLPWKDPRDFENCVGASEFDEDPDARRARFAAEKARREHE